MKLKWIGIGAVFMAAVLLLIAAVPISEPTLYNFDRRDFTIDDSITPTVVSNIIKVNLRSSQFSHDANGITLTNVTGVTGAGGSVGPGTSNVVAMFTPSGNNVTNSPLVVVSIVPGDTWDFNNRDLFPPDGGDFGKWNQHVQNFYTEDIIWGNGGTFHGKLYDGYCNGDPNALALIGDIGSVLRNTNGVPGSVLFVKESDNGGSSGWTPISSGGSGITGITNQVLATDGSGNVVGAGAPIWTNLPPVTDMEGGTVYGTGLLNPLGNNSTTFSLNYLTNFWGDFGFGVVIGNPFFDSSSVLISNVDVFGFGQYPYKNTTFSSNCFEVYAIGEGSIQNATLNHVGSIFANGFSGFYQASLVNVSDSYAFAHAFDTANFTNSKSLFGYGNYSLANAHGTNSNAVYAYGENSLEGANLDDAFDIYSFGNNTESFMSLSGKSHVMIVGSGGKATNSNDFVFGDNAYNYFFPGASARFEGPITSSGTVSANAVVATNGITNRGVTVLTPDAAQTLSAGTTIAVDASTILVAGNGGAVTLTSTPSIATNNVADGTVIYLRCTNSVNTVTLQDYRTLTGTCLAMDASTHTLSELTGAHFRWAAQEQMWIQVSFEGNTSQSMKVGSISTPQITLQSARFIRNVLTHAGTLTLNCDTNTVSKLVATGAVTIAFSATSTNWDYDLLIANSQATNITIASSGTNAWYGWDPTLSTLPAYKHGWFHFSPDPQTNTLIHSQYGEHQ